MYAPQLNQDVLMILVVVLGLGLYAVLFAAVYIVFRLLKRADRAAAAKDSRRGFEVKTAPGQLPGM